MAGFVPPGTTLLGNEATTAAAKKVNEVHKNVDYMNLPCPIPYEELHREALSSVPISPSLSLSLYSSFDLFIDMGFCFCCLVI
jgi:mitochondrial import receptor subunit TOM40